MYNLALALASMKDGQEQETERLNVQSALLRNSVSERRLREMKARFQHSHLVTNPIFHRGQMLTMIKLIANSDRVPAATGWNGATTSMSSRTLGCSSTPSICQT